MFLSVFEIFKIGVGPSSSHTMGPMTASSRFLKSLRGRSKAEQDARPPARFVCLLYGSLAFTGKGHGTDKAVIFGLLGWLPRNFKPEEAEKLERQVREDKRLKPPDLPEVDFDPEKDIKFEYGPPLPGHSNGMILRALDAAGKTILEETYYSIGGGFVLRKDELEQGKKPAEKKDVPFPFSNADEMLAMGKKSGKSIAEMKRENELTFISEAELNRGLDELVDVMNGCIERGLRIGGELPGGMHIKRRAKGIHEKLIEESKKNLQQPHVANDWISLYAMAVNEENAGGGRVVTAPTNGAAGVLPAVMRYYRDHCVGGSSEGVKTLILVAAAIGGVIKFNASISGAEVGCQGEVGSASAMAAAGLCAALGGSNMQVENAAEIALEHHLGMTCDPVNGLVQVPCIERNGLGAIKAVASASLALHGDGYHFISLDKCINTMRVTGHDMSEKYKETSKGGLAVNLPAC